MDLRKFAARWSAVAVVLLATSAAAQTTQPGYSRTNASREARIQRTIADTYSHRWEIFGGGGYLRFRSGEYTQKNNEVTWNFATSYYLNPKLAIVGDARGLFGNGKALRGTEYTTEAPNPQINEYTFTGGLGYRFYATQKLALSVQGLGGIGWGMFSGGAKGLTYAQIGFWQDAARPAFIGNLSVDYNVFPNVALRVAPTYVGTTFTGPSGGSVQNNVGVNAGIVYRFGRR